MNWEKLRWQKKRLVLLWLYILRTEPISEIRTAFAEPAWIDADPDIDVRQIPQHIFMMKPAQLVTELNQVGGPPSWIAQ